jgi:hypothetical protein
MIMPLSVRLSADSAGQLLQAIKPHVEQLQTTLRVTLFLDDVEAGCLERVRRGCLYSGARQRSLMSAGGLGR